MAKKSSKAKPKSDTEPGLHKDLKGFDIRLNSFGEMESTIDVDKINSFLNKHVPDKKLSDKDIEDSISRSEEEE